MNAYFIDAGERAITDDKIEGYDIWHTGQLVHMVIAETAGKAKSYAISHDRDLYNDDYTDLKAVKIASNVDLPAGFADDDEMLWRREDYRQYKRRAKAKHVKPMTWDDFTQAEDRAYDLANAAFDLQWETEDAEALKAAEAEREHFLREVLLYDPIPESEIAK